MGIGRASVNLYGYGNTGGRGGGKETWILVFVAAAVMKHGASVVIRCAKRSRILDQQPCRVDIVSFRTHHQRRLAHGTGGVDRHS